MATKEYSNDKITVLWDADKCQHSGNCVKGSPDVFNPSSKPWIDMQAEDSGKIMKTIDTCPSGALSYYKNHS